MNQDERNLQNEKRFAAANESIKETARSLSVEPVPFLCECSAMDCTAIVPLTLASYRRVRDSGAFLQIPGHDNPDVETVIEDCGNYVLVDKNAG